MAIAFLVALMFLLSGATGLGYQVLWSKFILDFIGVSAYSYATVLAAFMMGLALGSRILGRVADRVRSPLKLYAFLELGIGLYAIAYLPLTHLSASLYGQWVSFTPEYSGAGWGIWAKVFISGLILIPPTMLMGGTLPAMIRHVTENRDLVGRRVSQFYAINAFGAAFGALVMAFALMPILGMKSSLMALAVLNGLIGLVAYLVAGASKSHASPAVEAAGETVGMKPEAEDTTLTPGLVWLGLALVLVAGFLGFSYEIAWTRYFGIVLGSTTYSFAVMLAAFITGIATGSALLVRLQSKVTNPLRFFGWTQILAGLLVLLPLTLYPYVPWVFDLYGGLLSDARSAFYLYEFGKLGLCFLVMLPPTIFLGMSVPLVIRGLSGSLLKLGRDTGRVYAWNTWGNVLGALLAGLILLPLLGTQKLLSWTALATAVLGLVTLGVYTRGSKEQRRKSWATGGLVVGAILAVEVLSGPWDPRLLALEAFRRVSSHTSLQSVRAFQSARRVLLFEDDPAVNLMVIEQRFTAPYSGSLIALYVNGKPDATSLNDMPTQILSAHLPLFFHPNPKDVLIIGLASGITAGAALTHEVDRVDVVELVRAMPKATRFFSPWNEAPFSDPRFRVIFDDARSYVSYTNQKYDIIISEPSNPWIAGTGALFSRDYFRRATGALAPDGIYLQWLQGYEIGDALFAAVVRSFRQEFPYVYGFQGSFTDLLLLGSQRPLQLDYSAALERLQRVEVQRSLGRVNVVNIPTLLYFQRFSPVTIDFIASLTYLENTDDNHLLEHRAPRDLFQNLTTSLLVERDERLFSSPTLYWSEWVRRHPDETDFIVTLDALLPENVQSPPLLEAHQMTYFHSQSMDLFSERLQSDVRLTDSFWRKMPFTVAQITTRVDRLLELGRGGLAQDFLGPYGPAILLESVLSTEMAARWIGTVEEWIEASPEETNVAFRMLLVDLLAASGHESRFREELSALVSSAKPPRSDWAILRACRSDSRYCDKVTKIYMKREPSRWLSNFWALRHPEGL